MTVQAHRLLLAPPEDVWALLSEPYHLPDWWPGYLGVQPDRRGLAEGARWTVNRGTTRAATSNLIRRPGGEGTLVITRVVERGLLAWHDVDLRVDASVAIEPAAGRQTEATVSLTGSWARLTLEGLRSVPRQAVLRLFDLCQTAAGL
jgi:uncharacterized protein YndB with AHSA1/START domain